VENHAFTPALLEEVDAPLPNCHSRHLELHINNAAEFVSKESLLGDTLQQHHPLCGWRRLLYLGIGYRQPENRAGLYFYVDSVLQSYGIENAKEDPAPSFGDAQSRPRWASIIERLTESPIPIPSSLVV
jgi:hypothetical protein